MLTNSFIHAPRIGYRREHDLWKSGVRCWGDCLRGEAEAGVMPGLARGLREHIRASAKALDQSNGAYFEEWMPSREKWRLYREFKDRTVFLDIETTGLSHDFDDITVISIFDGGKPRALVKGKDLRDFPKIIEKYSLIITYNGATFDLPFLHTKFKGFKRAYAHIDLRYPLARLGFTGGLKGVEKKAGIRREGALSLVDGFMAVRLWSEYRRGSRKALSTLLRYALEDVANLRYLMEMTYNRSINSLPIRVPKLKHKAAPQIDIPFDARLIKRLAHDSLWC